MHLFQLFLPIMYSQYKATLFLTLYKQNYKPSSYSKFMSATRSENVWSTSNEYLSNHCTYIFACLNVKLSDAHYYHVYSDTTTLSFIIIPFPFSLISLTSPLAHLHTTLKISYISFIVIHRH